MGNKREKHLVTKRQEQLDNAFRQAATYSNFIKKVRVNVTKCNQRKKNNLRHEFKKHKKNEFYQWMAINHPNALREIDYSLEDIATMAVSGLSGIDVHRRNKNYNVDHIYSLNWCGTNDIRNLCLVPAELNRIKGDIEHFQDLLLGNKARSKNIKIIVPRKDINGEYIKFIPDMSVVNSPETSAQIYVPA